MHHNYDVEYTPTSEGYLVECYECGKEFEAVRFDAAFCSSTCRSRNFRKGKQLDKDIAKAKEIINELISRMPMQGESKTYNALTALRNRIDSALSVVEGDL